MTALLHRLKLKAKGRKYSFIFMLMSILHVMKKDIIIASLVSMVVPKQQVTDVRLLMSIFGGCCLAVAVVDESDSLWNWAKIEIKLCMRR